MEILDRITTPFLVITNIINIIPSIETNLVFKGDQEVTKRK